jgi:hypothetical protein
MLTLATFLFFSNIGIHHRVEIRACDGKLAALYLDEKMTYPMTNPLLTDSEGKVQFYTPAKCIRVTQF